MILNYLADNYLTLVILVGFAIIFAGLSKEDRIDNRSFLNGANVIFVGTVVGRLMIFLPIHTTDYVIVMMLVYLAVFALLFQRDYRNEDSVGIGIYIFSVITIVMSAALDSLIFLPEMKTMDPTAAFDLLLLFLYRIVEKQNKTRKKLIEKQNELMENQKKLADSKIRLLTKQIHRHFIYNSLVALKSLCRRDPEQAEIFAQNFSDFLRANLESMTEEQVVPFEKEREFIRLYLSLEQADPRSDFAVKTRYEVMDFFLPAFCVEPLVENAVQHGIPGAPDKGVLQISTFEKGEEIIIEVADNGLGMDSKVLEAKERESIGLNNIRARLANGIEGTEGTGGRLEIESDAYGTTARIILPKSYKILKGRSL